MKSRGKVIATPVDNVAPSRERGLKYNQSQQKHPAGRRSFAGAWIEIDDYEVEIPIRTVAPSRERGLK